MATLLAIAMGRSGAAQTYAFTTFAGTAGIPISGPIGRAGSRDAAGIEARFDGLQGVAVDSSGNLFVADTNNHTIRRITPDGGVTTFAGSAGSSGGVDGINGAARFNLPTGVAVDRSGNIFVADTQNHTIRKITAAGVVTTFAGTAGSSGSSDGTGGAARFNSPSGVTADLNGNVFVADTGNSVIRKIAADGTVTTLAGSAGSSGATDGAGAGARFGLPFGVAVDGSGNLFVTDALFVGSSRNPSYRNTIRKITSDGFVTTLVADDAQFGFSFGIGGLKGIAMSASGGVFVADSITRTIYRVTASGVVSTLAGRSAQGSADGQGTSASFGSPYGVAVDGNGTVFVADADNHNIRRITVAGVVTTLAGALASQGSVDGTGSAARFNQPAGLAVDQGGNVFVADAQNYTIRRITPNGVVTTFAGVAGSAGSADGTGSAARFSIPVGLTIDGNGNLFVADAPNRIIRRITSSGVVTIFAGVAGSAGSADGLGSAARFNWPFAVTADGQRNVFVADASDNTIRKITPDGMVTTLAGAAGIAGSADGIGSAARFFGPSGVAVDRDGNVFVTDTVNHTIRKITASGVVTTLAGSPGAAGSADGISAMARFNAPNAVAVDGMGNVFVADRGNHTIRRITPEGAVTTLAGQVGSPGSADGSARAVRFSFPDGVALDGSGAIFVSDQDNHTIRKGILVTNPARLINVSVLASLASGGDTVTVGTIIGGAGTNGTKPLLVRAAGPSLAAFGVTGPLDDPKLEFYRGPTKIAENDDWSGAPDLIAAFARSGAFPFAATTSKDAALYTASVGAGNNTVRVSGSGTVGGTVLAELYDATPAAAFTPATPRLVNVSVLNNVGSGLTAGFVIEGQGTETVLIRAVGPSLAPFGVSGLLADPKLELFDGQSRRIAANDNWSDAGALAAAELGAAFTQVGAFAFAGATSKDAALLFTLPPGTYTVQVRSADSTTGMVLLEVYEVP